MELAAKIMTVAGLGIIELWAAIPLGTALKLHPVLNAFASGLGAIAGALLVIIIGDKLSNYLLRSKKKPANKPGRVYRIWDKYGIIGLGLLSPLITGAPLGAALGMSLGAQPKQLFLWMSIGIIIWTILLTGISTIGFNLFKQLKFAF